MAHPHVTNFSLGGLEMGHAESDQSIAVAGDQQANPALMQVIIDTHGKPGDQGPKTGTLASTNIEQKQTEDMTVNQFPNGVKFGTGPGATSIEAPPGGKVVDKNGTEWGKSVGQEGAGVKSEGTLVYDKNHHVVAEFDKNHVMHVHTKNGEYTETTDGKVTFKPTAGSGDLSALHKSGAVPSNKLENYGVSTNGSTTRFGNGVEYNSATGEIKIPSEIPDFREDKKYDYKDDHLVARIGKDGNDKTLYTVDSTGLHVPTADGVLTKSPSGAVHFDKNPTTSASSLPDVTITGS
jgi:hypothetical protein